MFQLLLSEPLLNRTLPLERTTANGNRFWALAGLPPLRQRCALQMTEKWKLEQFVDSQIIGG